MFESIVLGLGWMFFFGLVLFFVPPIVVGSFQTWNSWYQRLKAIRAAARKE